VAADYLLYPTEVGENIWQSFPTGSILFGLGVATWLLVRTLRGRLASAWERPDARRRRLAGLAVYLSILAALSFVVRPEFARVSENRAINEVASNGSYSFWRAVVGADAPYEGLYRTLPPAEIESRLEHLFSVSEGRRVDLAGGSTLRHVENPGPPQRHNVVIVLEESLGSEFSALLSSRETSLTPELDRLAGQGTLLTQAYSTGNRTIRAIEATTSSLPPLPGASIVRRSQSQGLFTLPSLLAGVGYQTAFVYGGRALFDGMGGYLAANGVERIVDQGDMPENAFTTAWGVADEVIFDRALTEMDRMAATGRPFYTLVLTVSNHRPFAFPTDVVQPLPGLKRRDNAVRYADYALGRFLRQAEQHAFYDNTLFVLMGDHGARVYGAAEIPLGSYEVPILYLGPGIEHGRRIDTLSSSLDVPPTVLARLGLSYDSKFFGQDAFTVDPALGRALVTHNNSVALLRGGEIAVLGLQGRVETFAYRRVSRTFERNAALQRTERELQGDAIAYFNGADRAYRGGLYLAAPGEPSGAPQAVSEAPPAKPPVVSGGVPIARVTRPLTEL
ncbi:MAG: LTA synthase family protein, partial [Thermoanaerobaculia bacterium]